MKATVYEGAANPPGVDPHHRVHVLRDDGCVHAVPRRRAAGVAGAKPGRDPNQELHGSREEGGTHAEATNAARAVP